MRSIPFLSFIIVSLAPLNAPAASPARFLVQDGRANCVIVAAERAGSFHNFVAHELQRYIGLLSGATPEITRPSEISKTEKRILLLLGGPQANSLVRESVSSRQVDFSNLAKDGFLLWDVQVGGRSAVVIGGNDDASTMYAAYDFIERLGVTFLLARDIVPEEKPSLELPALEVRAETPFPRRGFFISSIFPNRGIMHLSEVKFMLDQMAKLKMNYLQFFWFAHEPWIRYEYQGEEKLLGDATGKETGYLTWTYNYGSYLINDLEVGRDLFNGRRRMAPAEFQNVESPADAYRVAKEFLTEIIRYAKTRKIDVWLAIDPTTLPGNLARLATRAPNLQLPFHPILGTHMCPADPVLHEINANRLRALVETYPEAEGYFLYIPEMFPDCNDERDRLLLLEERKNYDGLIKLWKPYTGYERDPSVVLDSTSSSIYIVKKMLEARQREAPNAKLGIGGIGRAFLLPFMDKLFPKDVPFTDMESSGVWTPTGVPMEYFGGMGERERTLVPRVDDDSSMFGMQFNVNLFYNDRLLEGSVENGVAGFAGQLNRIRGTEQNYRYLSEGAYHPKLKPREFYAS